MKPHIENLLHLALTALLADNVIPEMPPLVQIDMTKDKQHGDYATNVALMLAKAAKRKPRDIAELIVQNIPSSDYIEKVEIAGPGFINFFLSTAALGEVVKTILTEKTKFGRTAIGRQKRVLAEFVSSNPTGPLHVGHGRHAAFGAVVANLLDAVGFQVSREYYVNDAGRQMDILAVSVWLRYLESCGEEFAFPANGYQGDYIAAIANAIHANHGSHFHVDGATVFADLPLDEPAGGDKELYIDALIERTKQLLGDKYDAIFDLGLSNIVADIREDLAEFGVHFDQWFSERQFVQSGVVDRLLEQFAKSGYTYEQDGALWFKSSALGDEKDRVLVRSNGQRTYFANDVAYHLNKFERQFDIIIDIFGSDHHGYVPRIKAAISANGINPERMIHLLVQFVSLYRGDTQVPMSTRGGQFVTLRELRHEVGNDAARFFYCMRKAEQPMDFDLELAKSQSNDNPVYYVQYAYARICSVFKQLTERQLKFKADDSLSHLTLLTTQHERQLLNTLASYPDMIINAALHYEPHVLTHYLRHLAADFHSYYNSEQFIVEDEALRNARLALVAATRQVLLNGFNLLGISAPDTM